jgi:hypothetical protein
MTRALRLSSDGLQTHPQLWGPRLDCANCDHPLECVEQNRRSGTWLGSFLCPYCRSEYFYAYRWGRLIQKA